MTADDTTGAPQPAIPSPAPAPEPAKAEAANPGPASPEPASAGPVRPDAAGARGRWGGLSGRLLALTVLFVMLSEVLIFVPSVANFRNTWLNDKLTIAGVAASVLVEVDMVAPEVQAELLRVTGAVAIALDGGGRRRLIAMSKSPGEVRRLIDMGQMTPARAIAESFRTLLGGGGGLVRVVGPAQMGLGGRVDIVLPLDLLRDAMLAFSVRILALSLVISVITATLVYLSLRWLLVRPMQRLTRSMARFQEQPEDVARVIAPSGRADEMGDAERRLAEMQRTLAGTLQHQKRLADLGLAVSKINHDLRNLLAAAQLFSERLEQVADPTVQRLAPKIIATLDRAVTYTRSVLAYGSAREAPLKRRLVRLDMVVGDVGEVLHLSTGDAVRFENQVPEGMEIDADPEQVFRILMNLCRNAAQAMTANGGPEVVRRITVEAVRAGDAVEIRIKDTGPGIPPVLRGKLFQPFQSTAKSGGTGLGLAITAELVRAHGGSIRLVEGEGPGAQFEIRIPDREQGDARKP